MLASCPASGRRPRLGSLGLAHPITVTSPTGAGGTAGSADAREALDTQPRSTSTASPVGSTSGTITSYPYVPRQGRLRTNRVDPAAYVPDVWTRVQSRASGMGWE